MGLWALILLFGPSVAVDRLPDFLAAPNAPGGQPLPHHQCSIHLNCEDTLLLHRAFEDAMDGLPSHRWVAAGLWCPLLQSYTHGPGEGWVRGLSRHGKDCLFLLVLNIHSVSESA